MRDLDHGWDGCEELLEHVAEALEVGQHCEECGAVLAEGEVLVCSRCASRMEVL